MTQSHTEKTSPSSWTQPAHRFPLPMSTGVWILPGQCATLTARPQLPFYPERLLIKNAERWRIHEIQVASGSQEPRKLAKSLPGERFALGAPGRFPGAGELLVPAGDQVIVNLEYVGPLEAGEPFEACVFGSDDRAVVSPVVPSSSPKLAAARTECRILPGTSAKLLTDPGEHPLWPDRLAIHDSQDWIVHDVLLGDRSLFAQSGDVPGVLFAKSSHASIQMGRLDAGDRFCVYATYVGANPGGAELAYDLFGTRDAPAVSIAPRRQAILPMSSGVNILPETSAQMTSRCLPSSPRVTGLPTGYGFRARRIALDQAADWTICDVKIGNLSQFLQSGDVPGVAFDPMAQGCQVAFGAAPVGIDVTFVATCVSPLESGRAFVCGIVGDIVPMGPTY